jgi:hypothetical protein
MKKGEGAELGGAGRLRANAPRNDDLYGHRRDALLRFGFAYAASAYAVISGSSASVFSTSASGYS